MKNDYYFFRYEVRHAKQVGVIGAGDGVWGVPRKFSPREAYDEILEHIRVKNEEAGLSRKDGQIRFLDFKRV